MEETISTETHSTRVLRLALVFLGAVLGFVLLGFVFGSSSARADDGGDSPDSLGSAVGGLVSQITEPVQATITTPAAAVAKPIVTPIIAQVPIATPVTPASTIITPVATLADTTVVKLFGDTALGDVLGTSPVASILAPVAQVVDGTVADAVGPVSGTDARVAVTAAIATLQAVPATASGLVSGAAQGVLDLGDSGAGETGAVGFSPVGSGLLAAMAGAGFFVLLAVRRQTLTTRAMPGSPVYETDSSPD